MDLDATLQSHVEYHADLYAPGILRPDKHYQLVNALSRICKASGIRREFVTHSAKEFCGAEELKWVSNLRSHDAAGLVYIAQNNVEDRMMALAGVCLRNYLHARVITIHSLLQELENGEYDHPRVLLIPNFCTVTKSHSISTWDANAIYDIVLSRYTQRLQTVLAIQSLRYVGDMYGIAAKQHIESNYISIE